MGLGVLCWTRFVASGGWASRCWEMGMDFFCKMRGGIIGGGTSISVGLAEFCLGVSA